MGYLPVGPLLKQSAMQVWEMMGGIYMNDWGRRGNI